MKQIIKFELLEGKKRELHYYLTQRSGLLALRMNV